jgi:hypothetical protein
MGWAPGRRQAIAGESAGREGISTSVGAQAGGPLDGEEVVHPVDFGAVWA